MGAPSRVQYNLTDLLRKASLTALIMFINHAAATRTGHRTQDNQDAHVAISEARVFALADGIGIAPDGARAANLAIDALTDYYRNLAGFGDPDHDTPPSASSRLRVAIDRANQRIWRENVDANPMRRMGTTLLVTQFLSEQVVLSALGDSRAYRLRNRTLERLTRDHVLLDEHRSQLTPSEARDLEPLQKVLTRSVGRSAVVEPDMFSLDLQVEDLYLLCSNGITDGLDDDAIASILSSGTELQATCNELVLQATSVRDDDDATAIVIQVGRPSRWRPTDG
jgi:PPM family protein phosphatase